MVVGTSSAWDTGPPKIGWMKDYPRIYSGIQIHMAAINRLIAMLPLPLPPFPQPQTPQINTKPRPVPLVPSASAVVSSNVVSSCGVVGCGLRITHNHSLISLVPRCDRISFPCFDKPRPVSAVSLSSTPPSVVTDAKSAATTVVANDKSVPFKKVLLTINSLPSTATAVDPPISDSKPPIVDPPLISESKLPIVDPPLILPVLDPPIHCSPIPIDPDPPPLLENSFDQFPPTGYGRVLSKLLGDDPRHLVKWNPAMRLYMNTCLNQDFLRDEIADAGYPPNIPARFGKVTLGSMSS